MPDLPVEPASGGRYPADMETRVALLEQIAQTNAGTFARVERQMEAMAAENRAALRSLSEQQRADFRWLLGIMLVGFGLMLGSFGATLGVMAHGFHWL